MSAATGSAKKTARNGGGLFLAGASGLAAWATLSNGSGSPLFAAPSTASSASTAAETSLRGALSAAEFGAVPAASQSPEATNSFLGGAAVAALAAGSVAVAARRRSANTTTRREVGVARAAASAPLVVIAGPPAAGKGTQCEKIKAKYGYVHISTGDILRENVKNGTELGKKAKEYMDSGALVPSELIVDLVKDRLTKDDVKEKGCLLDGFPRAPDQAQAMSDAGIDVQRFLLIKVPDETLVERGCGRRLDPESGEIYHLKFKPPPAEIMDRLVHRSDDQEESIRVRLGNYHSQIDGILPFFKDAVVEIDGTGKPDDVFTSVTEGLDSM